MPPKKKTPFQRHHHLEYSLEIVSTDAKGDMTVRCLFCLNEGRDTVVVHAGSSRKRKSRTDIKYFKSPFLPHQYPSHHTGQHAESWEAYKAAYTEDKQRFFDGKVDAVNTMHRHMDLATDTLTLMVQPSIVDSIIVDLFFGTCPKKTNKWTHL